MSDATGNLPSLYAALAVAQARIVGARKDAENPYFRSRYADLASIREACNEALTAQGLCVIQFPETTVHGEAEAYTFTAKKSGEERAGVRAVTEVGVRTRIGHSSGEYVEGVVSALLPSADPQAVGSAITYLRRYALAAMVGVAPEDDDGEGATRPVPKGVDRETGEIGGGNDQRLVEAVTLESEVPFGKHKGKKVREAGSGYFDYLAGQSDFADAKGRAWHTFTLGAIAAFAAAEQTQADGAPGAAEDEELFGKPEPAPAPVGIAPENDESKATTAAVAALREYLKSSEVPEHTFKTYTRMLDGMRENVTVSDVQRIRASVAKAVKAAS